MSDEALGSATGDVARDARHGGLGTARAARLTWNIERRLGKR
jgi:hypothetical protein